MALTTTDIQQIRQVMDESIAHHPRFDELKSDIISELSGRIAEFGEVLNESLEMIDHRFDSIENRLDNLRIVSR
jgi:galactokinase